MRPSSNTEEGSKLLARDSNNPSASIIDDKVAVCRSLFSQKGSIFDVDARPKDVHLSAKDVYLLG